MSNRNFENNNNAEPVSANPTNSLIYKFEHGERLKAEREAKERQKALFAKKMAKFGEGEQDDKPKSTNAVNQKAKMFVEIANKDPEKERAERERKLEFERKKLGFQEGSVPCNNNTKESIGSEVLKKKQIFTVEIEALDEEGQRKKQEEEELKEQRKREFQEKSSLFNQSNE